MNTLRETIDVRVSNYGVCFDCEHYGLPLVPLECLECFDADAYKGEVED